MEKPLHFEMPESEGRIIVIPAEGNKFIGGISYHYKEYYPPELEAYIEFDDYQRIFTDINETVKSFWPWAFTICLGYFLCPFTLGLSLLMPNLCIHDAEKEIKKIVNTANEDYFIRKGAHMEFVRKRSNSWFEIRLPDAGVIQILAQ